MSSSPPDELDLTLHPLLRYYQHGVVEGHCTSILWDLREPPLPAGIRNVASLSVAFSETELMQPATSPPLRSLRIMCGFFPEPWPVEALGHNTNSPLQRGSSNVCVEAGSGSAAVVTVLDVLDAIYTTLQHQITHEEWGKMCPKHQNRVSAMFDARWRAAPDPVETHANGVLRVDCLLHYTWFGGLSVLSKSVAEYGEGCILSLRRPR